MSVTDIFIAALMLFYYFEQFAFCCIVFQFQCENLPNPVYTYLENSLIYWENDFIVLD